MLSTVIQHRLIPPHHTPVGQAHLFPNDSLPGRQIPRAGFDIVFRDLSSGYELHFYPGHLMSRVQSSLTSDRSLRIIRSRLSTHPSRINGLGMFAFHPSTLKNCITMSDYSILANHRLNESATAHDVPAQDLSHDGHLDAGLNDDIPEEYVLALHTGHRTHLISIGISSIVSFGTTTTSGTDCFTTSLSRTCGSQPQTTYPFSMVSNGT